MKALFSEIRGAVFATLILAIVCCGLYPLVVFGISQALFRDKANGSLIVDQDGTVRGSKLLAQGFTADKYFHPRPSAAGNGYDAASSGGSNLGPTSQKLSDAIKDRVAAYRKENGLSETEPVPADAVTASGSGLDPQISLRNAELQTPRVAKARGLSEEKVRELVQQNTDVRNLGVLGEPGVNVLELNLALDSTAERDLNNALGLNHDLMWTWFLPNPLCPPNKSKWNW
jgi:K+-transporting ATPase ATPase C chain